MSFNLFVHYKAKKIPNYWGSLVFLAEILGL